MIRYDAANVSASSVKLDVPLASFTSHVPKLDEMLLGPEFFAAGKYPAIGFESTSVEDKGNGRLLIHGKLRIKDHEKAIVLEARQNKAGVHPTRSGRQSASTRPRSSSAAISASRRTRPTSATRSRCASRSKRWPTRRAEHSGDERLV
ncbi:MAG: YceI family protein [Achromobacter xylosoxidans]